MIEQEEKVGVWNLPEPTDAEEIAYLRHANALLRESIQHQCQLFDNVKAAAMLLHSLKAQIQADAGHDTIVMVEQVSCDIDHVLLLLGGV